MKRAVRETGRPFFVSMGMTRLLLLILLLSACASDEVERPTNEEVERLDEVESMLDED